MDPLGAVLADFTTRQVFVCVSELRAPWGIALPAMPGTLMFHVLTAGQAVVDVGDERVTLAAGRMMLVPQGGGHRIRSDADAAAADLRGLTRRAYGDIYERMEIDGGGAPARLICGALSFTDPAVARLAVSLPAVLLGPEHDDTVLDQLIGVLEGEAHDHTLGSEVITTRLADILVVRTIRDWLAHTPAADGWIAALRDPDLGVALAAVHADPAQPWTVAQMAATAGLSRSGFAKRFTDVVGVSPLAFVTELRLEAATRLLSTTQLSAAAIARRVGYGSDQAFSRAFQRSFACTPGHWRRSNGPVDWAAP